MLRGSLGFSVIGLRKQLQSIFNYYNVVGKGQWQSEHSIMEVSAMSSCSGFSGEGFDFVCFRCASTVRPGQRMVNMSVSIETPTDFSSVRSIEATTVSTLCVPCAAVLLSRAIVSRPKLMMPPERETEDEDLETEEEDEGSSGYFGSIRDMLETVHYGCDPEEDAEVSDAEGEDNDL